MALNHRCPRRAENPASDHMFPGDDTWRDDGTCSYCGSMSGDAFIKAIEEGREIGPTDKNYKVYVKGGPFAKFYFQHLSKDQRQKFIELYNNKVMRIGPPGHFYNPPYFMAFRDD